MRRSWRSLFSAIALVTGATAIGISACSGGERPLVAADEREGGSTPPQLNEAGTSFEAGDAEGGVTPDTCVNTIKDGAETDVDCGGNVCGKCIDGKTCIAKTDCAGGACLNGKCATPACTNKETDGDETDTDCGGSICAKCTTGKRCTKASDCVSAACTNNFCRCPKGMIESSRAGGGGAYCIDEIEVTKYQYNKFITANVPINDQDSVCKPPVNDTFVPRDGWPVIEAPPSLPTPGSGTAFNFSLPVHYVDWCDAYAYCRWAGKQLCGSVTGGPVAFDKANHADAGAWFNACSAQGAKPYSYGTEFIPGKCNGEADPDAGVNRNCGPMTNQRSNFGCTENKDYGIHASNNGDGNGNYTIIYGAGCAGGVTGLFHMLGNVAEWEDSCDGNLATSGCRVRGGSYTAGDDNAVALSCAGERVVQRVPPPPSSGEVDPLADIGFRCCLY